MNLDDAFRDAREKAPLVAAKLHELELMCVPLCLWLKEHDCQPHGVSRDGRLLSDPMPRLIEFASSSPTLAAHILALALEVLAALRLGLDLREGVDE